MSKLAVKYDNKMNLLAFKDLEKVEANLFFSIVARAKEKGGEKITLSFSEIAEFLEANYTNAQLREMIAKGVGKIVRTAIKWENKEGLRIFTLFKDFFIPHNENYLIVSINEPFLYILNNFESGNFTMFELAEFSSLSSKYTQTLYRLLKQFKSTGYRSIKWADFIEIMDIPKSYNMGTIDNQILKPAIKELTQEADIFNQNNPIFKKLLYKKNRGKGRGRPIKSIEFYFTPRKETDKEQKQSDRALEYIAHDIKQEQILKQIKKDTTKNQEPKKLEIRTDLFGNKVSDLDAFLNRHFKVKNKYDGGYDSCKIKELYQNSNGKIQGIAINQENNKTFDLNFESIEHLKNSLKIK